MWWYWWRLYTTPHVTCFTCVSVNLIDWMSKRNVDRKTLMHWSILLDTVWSCGTFRYISTDNLIMASFQNKHIFFLVDMLVFMLTEIFCFGWNLRVRSKHASKHSMTTRIVILPDIAISYISRWVHLIATQAKALSCLLCCSTVKSLI